MRVLIKFILASVVVIGCNSKPKETLKYSICCPVNLDSARKSKNFPELIKLVDWKYVFYLVSHSVENNGNELDEIKDEFLKGSSQFSSYEDAANLFRFTNSYEEQNKTHLVYELYKFDDFNFIDITIDENLKISDVFLYGMGVGVGKIIIQGITDKKIDKRNLLIFNVANKSLVNGDYEDAWDQINLLPIEMQKKFPYQNVKIKIAESDLTLYSKLVDDIEKRTSEERFIQYLKLKEAIFAKDYQLMAKWCRELRKTVGESVNLLIYEAIVDVKAGKNYQKALDKYLRMIELAPEFVSGYISVIDVLLEQSNHGEAEKYFQLATKKFQILKSDWHELLPEYSDFINRQFR